MILTPNSLQATGVFTDFQKPANIGTGDLDLFDQLLGLNHSLNPTENKTEQTPFGKLAQNDLLESLFPSVKTESNSASAEEAPEKVEEAKAWSPMLPLMPVAQMPTVVMPTLPLQQADTAESAQRAPVPNPAQDTGMKTALPDVVQIQQNKKPEVSASIPMEVAPKTSQAPTQVVPSSVQANVENSKQLNGNVSKPMAPSTQVTQSNTAPVDLKTLTAQMQQLFPESKVKKDETKVAEADTSAPGTSVKDFLRMMNVSNPAAQKAKESEVVADAVDKTDKSQKMQRFVQVGEMNPTSKNIQNKEVEEMALGGSKESSKDKKSGIEATSSDALFSVKGNTTLSGNPASKTAETQSVTVPQFMEKVNSLVHKGGGTMKVTLNPPELGEVEISVTTRGKKVEIAMKSESSQSKSILEGQVQELKNSIQSHDMVMTKFEVSVAKDFDSNWNQNSFAHLGFQDSKQNGNQPSKNAMPFQGAEKAPMNVARVAASSWTPKASTSGGVDLRI